MTVTACFQVKPLPPYSLALTAARFARFPEIVDCFDGEIYRRLLLVEEHPVLMAVAQSGSPTETTLNVQLSGNGANSSAARVGAMRVLERALGTSSEVRTFYRALKGDPILGSSLRTFRGLRIAGWPDVWEALVSTVLCQQVNLPFAYGIRRELVSELGLGARFDGETYRTFPTPIRILHEGVDRLRRFRLSQAKAETIVRLAKSFDVGELSETELEGLADDEVVDRLTAIKGVGTWTAETVLLRGLGRPDAFPAGDLGVVKYLALGLLRRSDRATENEMRSYAEAWRPYRGLALVYAYAELNRRKRVKES